MHKVNSPNELERIVYCEKEDGTVDVWIRDNIRAIEIQQPEEQEKPDQSSAEADQEQEEETEKPQVVYEADEVFCRVTNITKEEIAADVDYWFDQLRDARDGTNADHLGVEARRAAKMTEISQACEGTIVRGVDVTLADGTQHFSLTVKDQINLFGKQAQLAAGADRCEYHQDGMPCKFYGREDMQEVIATAMKHVSYNQTYCNSMYNWIRSCTKASEIGVIEYGAEIPKEYWSEVLRDYKGGAK